MHFYFLYRISALDTVTSFQIALQRALQDCLARAAQAGFASQLVRHLVAADAAARDGGAMALLDAVIRFALCAAKLYDWELGLRGVLP